MKHRCRRVAKYEGLEEVLVYTDCNMTCSPRVNRQYPAPNGAVVPAPHGATGRTHGTGGATLTRIQKSKNSGSWRSKYFTAQKTLVWLRTGVRQKDF
jgi:hypothetical protein